MKEDPSKYTIKDIAHICGVGVGTVSRVLNGGINVKKETHEKILKVIRQLDYQPNQAARSLKKGNYALRTIGVVLPIIVHPFYFEILKGIYEGISETGHNIMIFNIGKDPNELYEHIAAEKLAGIIIVSTPIPGAALRSFHLHHTPLIFVDYHQREEHSIYIDNEEGGRIAARYLLSKGVRKPAYIGDVAYSQQQEDRIKGFRLECEKKRVSILIERFLPVYSDDSYQETKSLISHEGVEGIFYFCDHQAYGGLKARDELGSRIAIIGYDDMLPSEYLDLTTIRQPAIEMGRTAAHKIVSIAVEAADEVIHESIHPTLIQRST